MDMDQFCRRLEQSLQLPAASLTPDKAFADIDHFDSMAQIEVILLMDEMYGVQIEAETLPTLTYIRDLAPLVPGVSSAAIQ